MLLLALSACGPDEIVSPGTGGNVTINTPAGTANQGLWFRFGLFDNPNAAGSKTVNNWLGYTAMAQSTAANSLYERIGGSTSGDFASSIFGTAGRTPDASPAYVGANSPAGVVTLRFDQTITRTATGVVVTFLIKRTDTNAVLMNYTYTDATPNNNGVLSGAQTTANGYNPTYNTSDWRAGGPYTSVATEGDGKTLWHGRFASGPAEALLAFYGESALG